MPEGMRWVGLDVHAYETACAVFDGTTGELEGRRFRGRPHELLDWLGGIERPFRAVYEAGPSGYGLARRAAELGLDVSVCAPGHIARKPGDRVKADKRDALRLARLLAAGDLTLVAVPPVEHERVRDLVRCREDVRGDLMRVRHRIGKFLLRRELYHPGRGGGWTRRHLGWLSGLRFDDRASELCFADYMHAHDVLLARREGLDRALSEIAQDCPWSAPIGRLRCLRGINTLTALGLCAEVSDFGRFPRPEAVGAYLGLVPSESSSGERRRQGSITKAGSAHARRLLVEAAHHYSRPPRVSAQLRRRQEGQPAWVIETAWRCQRRLFGRWQRPRVERGKRGGIVIVAIAPELATLCRELAVTERAQHSRSPVAGAARGDAIRARRRPAMPLSATTQKWWRPSLDSGPCDEQTVLGPASPEYQPDRRSRVRPPAPHQEPVIKQENPATPRPIRLPAQRAASISAAQPVAAGGEFPTRAGIRTTGTGCRRCDHYAWSA